MADHPNSREGAARLPMNPTDPRGVAKEAMQLAKEVERVVLTDAAGVPRIIVSMQSEPLEP